MRVDGGGARAAHKAKIIMRTFGNYAMVCVNSVVLGVDLLCYDDFGREKRDFGG